MSISPLASRYFAVFNEKNHFKMANVSLRAANLITDERRESCVSREINHSKNTTSAFIVVKVTDLFAVKSAG